MRSMKFCVVTIAAVLGLLVCVHSVFADDIKDRMKSRLPIINELKAQGLVGENNQGFLEFRSDKKTQADVVSAENQDRTEVYRAIAARQSTTPEFVGRARAAQIAGKESSGTWVQDSSGTWNRK